MPSVAVIRRMAHALRGCRTVEAWYVFCTLPLVFRFCEATATAHDSGSVGLRLRAS